MADWVIWLMERLGAPGAGLAVALETVFPPIPSELILPLAGFTASQGSLNLAAIIAWTTAGSLVGAIVLYTLGSRLGEDRLRRAAARLPLTKVADLDRTKAWFERHGRKAVFLGRMVPVFRSLISIPAGLAHMRRRTFAALTVGGSLIWNSALILAGYALGTQWQLVRRYTGILQTVVLIGLGAWLVWFVVRRARQHTGSESAGDADR